MTDKTLTKKQDILEMIQRMPESLSEDDVIYALYVRKSIERGIADAEAGRFATDDDVKRVLGKWQTSAGQ